MTRKGEIGTKSLECLIINYRPTLFEFRNFGKKWSEVSLPLGNFKGDDFLMQKLSRWKFERHRRKKEEDMSQENLELFAELSQLIKFPEISLLRLANEVL